jgi:hypothetical protein
MVGLVAKNWPSIEEETNVRKEKATLLTCVLVLMMLVGCGTSSETGSSTNEPAPAGQAAQATAAQPTATQSPAVAELSESIAEDIEDHADAEAEVLDSSESIAIALNGDSISVGGAGATVSGSTVTIIFPGTYELSGSLTDGQVIVDVQDGIVGLVLNGVNISSSTGPAIYIPTAQEAVIVLADGTENQVSDGNARENEGSEDEPTAAIFSMADLTLSGSGSLDVDGNYQDGITSKDGLVVTGGTIIVHSVDDGIRGKDYIIVRDGEITVDAGDDGLKSDNEVDTTQGYVRIEDGNLEVTAGGDAIQAQTAAMVSGGQLTLTSGGGHSGWVDESASAKGIKGVASVTIDGGTFSIASADDAIHSNGSIVINDGTFVLSTGDDGIHADESLEINGGDIRITDSYEGLESALITVNGGDIHIASSDDAINVAAGNDGSGFAAGPGRGGGRGQMPGGGQGQFPGDGQMPGGRPGRGQPEGGWPGQDAFTAGDNHLQINGGYIAIDAYGDGLDVNGTIEMTDGVVLISGPTSNMNGALDYLGQFNITGGFLVAAGSAGMAQAPSNSSEQYSLLVNFNGVAQAGTLVHIQTSGGVQVLTFAPAKQFQSLVFSSSELQDGATYNLYLGGSADGNVSDGLYQGGSYTSGTKVTSFTVSDIVTWLGGRLR